MRWRTSIAPWWMDQIWRSERRQDPALYAGSMSPTVMGIRSHATGQIPAGRLCRTMAWPIVGHFFFFFFFFFPMLGNRFLTAAFTFFCSAGVPL
jgi:hypothetical protein